MVYADTAPFDLAGPKLDMRVTRKGKTLPAAEVPNLQPGDRVWVHPDFPTTQSAHYLLVIAFLRGATNPPPEKWFLHAETWTKKVSEEGLVFTGPSDAEQTLLFLAPETGGGFKTLRDAVRGRPGAFVRSSQDLNQASLDRSRVQTYLAAVRKTSDTDPAELQQTSTLLARSLNMKVKEDCFNKPSSEQEQCLTQNSDQLVLNDGHSQSMVSTLTNGAGSDLVTQLSATPTAGAGYYSAYVGAVVDLAKLLESFHTAEYQYIPALTVPRQDSLDLKLNNPPSFHKPQSVIVVALPAIEAAQLPPLRAVDPKELSCLHGSSFVLPVEGAPLVFSSSLAHNLALHIQGPSGKGIDLPLHADASKGGLVTDASDIPAAGLPARVSGRVRGQWGFEPLDGPSFTLVVPHPTNWIVPPADTNSLIVGRDDDLHLQGDAAQCVASVAIRDANGTQSKAVFKVVKPDEIEIKVPLTNMSAGNLSLLVQQVGMQKPDEVVLHTYAQAGHLDDLSFHAGDSAGTLTGTRLDEVAGLDLNGVHFTPGELSHADDKDALKLNAADPSSAKALTVTAKTSARVTLKDGRILTLPASVQTARPQISLMSKSVEADAALASSNVHLASPDELPMGGRVSFFLKTIVPASFPRTEKIEVAAADGSFHTLMDLNDGSLLLQDATTMLGTLDLLKRFGPSAFGALQLRAVDATGARSDWQPLGTLVRLPVLSSVHCPKASRPSTATPAAPAAPDDSPAATSEKGSSASSPSAASAQAGAAASAQPGGAGAASVAAPKAAGETPTTDPDAQCTLTGSSLFLIDSVGSDAQFAHSISVPDGFNGTTLSVPRPLNGQLFFRLRDDASVANTFTVPAGSMQSSAHSGDLPAGSRRVARTQPHDASTPDEDTR
ncbi:MAG: hypothetical protein ACR2JE_16090 [Acidobacteriaceae bacterium]